MIPRKTLEVTRFTAGLRDKGQWQEGTPSNFNITASVQPLKPREMEMLPEARRNSQSYRLYTDTLLKTVNKVNGISPDKVEIDGENFEVFSVGHWQNNIIPHYKVIVIKL